MRLRQIMNKNFLFTLLFLSWIAGLSLICVFPPIPDYQVDGESSGSISQDVLPELHQRNNSLVGIFQLELGIELMGIASDFDFNSGIDFEFLPVKGDCFAQITSHFNTRLLFKAFFETW